MNNNKVRNNNQWFTIVNQQTAKVKSQDCALKSLGFGTQNRTEGSRAGRKE